MKRRWMVLIAALLVSLALPVCAQEGGNALRALVDGKIVPMALANDDGEVVEAFSAGELAQVIALVEESGLTVPESLRERADGGEGYWEEETIMALAKAQFGPIPAGWTLEDQFWFEEAVIAIGFKDYNSRRVPGEGELSYDEALDKAEAALVEAYAADGLRNTQAYRVLCMYQEWKDEDGALHGPEWYIEFEPLAPGGDWYDVTMDRDGNVTAVNVEKMES